MTVVIPLFNGAPHIEETLNSVAGQSMSAAAVIVVDDGSTDDGAERARRHAVGATVIEQPNLGVAVARNHGLAATRTRWVTFLDQDDLWHPEHLDRAITWLKEHPDERIVLAEETFFATDEDVEALAEDLAATEFVRVHVPRDAALSTLAKTALPRGEPRVDRFDVDAVLAGPITTTTSFVADADLVRCVGGFPTHARSIDDYLLLVNVARLQAIPRVSQRTVFYRVHSGATSRSTRIGLAYLSSAIALRLGGQLVFDDRALMGAPDGGLLGHLLTDLTRSTRYRDRRFRAVVGGLAVVIWPPSGRRLQRLRASVRTRLPWLVSLRGLGNVRAKG